MPKRAPPVVLQFFSMQRQRCSFAKLSGNVVLRHSLGWLLLSALVSSMIVHDTSPLPSVPGRPPDYVNAETVTSIVTDSSGNLIATGFTDGDLCGIEHTAGNGREVFVAKYNRLGKLLWMRVYGRAGKDFGDTVRLASELIHIISTARASPSGVEYARLSSTGEVLMRLDLPGIRPSACEFYCKGLAVGSTTVPSAGTKNRVAMFYHQTEGSSDLCYIVQFPQSATKSSDMDWLITLPLDSAPQVQRYQCKTMEIAGRDHYWIAGTKGVDSFVVLLRASDGQVAKEFVLSTADAKPVVIRAILSSQFVSKGLPFKCTIGGYTAGHFDVDVYPNGHINKGKEDAFVATVNLMDAANPKVNMQIFATEGTDTVVALEQNVNSNLVVAIGHSTGILDTSSKWEDNTNVPFIVRLHSSMDFVHSITQMNFFFSGLAYDIVLDLSSSADILYVGGMAKQNELLNGDDAAIAKLEWKASRYKVMPTAQFGVWDTVQFSVSGNMNSIYSTQKNVPVVKVREDVGELVLEVTRVPGAGVGAEMCGTQALVVSALNPGSLMPPPGVGNEDFILRYAEAPDQIASTDGDFSVETQIINLPRGTTTALVKVRIINDEVDDLDEWIQLRMAAAKSATGSTDEAFASLLNAPGEPNEVLTIVLKAAEPGKIQKAYTRPGLVIGPQNATEIHIIDDDKKVVDDLDQKTAAQIAQEQEEARRTAGVYTFAIIGVVSFLLAVAVLRMLYLRHMAHNEHFMETVKEQRQINSEEHFEERMKRKSRRDQTKSERAHKEKEEAKDRKQRMKKKGRRWSLTLTEHRNAVAPRAPQNQKSQKRSMLKSSASFHISTSKMNPADATVQDHEVMKFQDQVVRLKQPLAGQVHILCTTGKICSGTDNGGRVIVKADSVLPSLVTKNRLLKKGKWYFECTWFGAPETAPRIGWACPSFTGDENEHDGLGDDRWSWAIDGRKLTKRHMSQDETWGGLWKSGDVIGCACDIQSRSLLFSLNGKWQKPMGIAFPRMRPIGGIVPAVTLKEGGTVVLNFGQTSFVHLPPDGQYKAVCKGRAEEGYEMQIQEVDEADTERFSQVASEPIKKSSGPSLSMVKEQQSHPRRTIVRTKDTEIVGLENRRESLQQRRASFSNTRRRRMSADQKELEKLTLECVQGLKVVNDSFERSIDGADPAEENKHLKVIESMLERHKGVARMESMSVGALEKAKANLAVRLAGEVVAYVTNIRPRLTEDSQAEVMEMFLYVVIDQLDEYFVELV